MDYGSGSQLGGWSSQYQGWAHCSISADLGANEFRDDVEDLGRASWRPRALWCGSVPCLHPDYLWCSCCQHQASKALGHDPWSWPLVSAHALHATSRRKCRGAANSIAWQFVWVLLRFPGVELTARCASFAPKDARRAGSTLGGVGFWTPWHPGWVGWSALSDHRIHEDGCNVWCSLQRSLWRWSSARRRRWSDRRWRCPRWTPRRLGPAFELFQRAVDRTDAGVGLVWVIYSCVVVITIWLYNNKY